MIREERNALLLLVAFTAAASLLYFAVLRPALQDATRPLPVRSPEASPAAGAFEADAAPDPRPKSARRMLGLEALLVDAVTGRPLPDAEVRVTRIDDIAEPTAALDDGGVLRVEHLPPDITFGLRVECDGYEPRDFPTVRGEAHEVVRLGVVALEPRRRASVRVRADGGAPLEGARVAVHPRDDAAPAGDALERAARVAEALHSDPLATAVTDADGAATLRDLPAAAAVALVSDGVRPAVAHELDAFAGDVDEPVRLGPGVSFRGRIVDPSDAPVPAATVVMVEARDTPGPGLSVATAETDGEGRFSAPRVAPAPHFVFVHAPGRAAVGLGPYPVDAAAEVVVAVPDGATLSGSLRTRAGGTPAGVEVTARADVAGALSLNAVTGRDGAFAIDGVAVGHAALEARAAGFAPERTVVPVASFGAEVDLRLDPPGTLTGVVTSRGAPLSGAVVRDRAGGARAVTDLAGAFRLEGLAAGRVRLETRAPRHAPARTEAEVRLRDESSATIELAPGGVLRVVVQGRDGEARPDALVAAHAVDDAGRLAPLARAVAATDTEGRARLTNLRNDERIVLFARARGFAPSRSNPLELTASLRESGVAITLGAGGPAEGVVRDAAGAPAGGAVVVAEDETPGGDGRLEFGPRAARTAEDGSFRLERLPPGRLRLVARRGGERAVSAPIVVRDGEPARDVELTLAPADRLHGRVLDAAGRPVAGATVTLVEAAPAAGPDGGEAETGPDRAPTSARTDAAGRFVFAPSRPVALVLEASADGRRAAAEVAPGTDAVLLRLE